MKLPAVRPKSLAIGKHSEGAGLWIHKRNDDGGQWFLRITIHGRHREMGLGGYPGVSLKEARTSHLKFHGLRLAIKLETKEIRLTKDRTFSNNAEF